MPDERPYSHYNHIIIRFLDSFKASDRNAWEAATLGLLEQIRAIPLGADLMDEIQDTGHKVFIQPAIAQGNQCAASNRNCFVKLRQAIDGLAGDVKTEFQTALDRAARSQVTLQGIAKRIAAGMSVMTVETDKNVARPSGPAKFMALARDKAGKVLRKDNMDVRKDAKLTPEKIEQLLRGLLDGSTKMLDLNITRDGRWFKDDLLRAFYIPDPKLATEWAPRGAGCSATISFNPTKEDSCWNNVLIKRPPGIGLVHEMIHAWRNVLGLRYFPDKEKHANAPTPDDEVMTTGFPPYQYEKFSENLFRGLWAIPQPPRTSY